MTATDEGLIRIMFTDNDRENVRTLWEGRTELLDISTDKRQQVQMPYFSKVSIAEDDKMIVQFKADVTTTMDYGASTVRIPVTRYNKATKTETPTYLVDADLRSADVSFTGGEWKDLGVYTVGAQKALKLGQEIADNSQMYISGTENE